MKWEMCENCEVCWCMTDSTAMDCMHCIASKMRRQRDNETDRGLERDGWSNCSSDSCHQLSATGRTATRSADNESSCLGSTPSSSSGPKKNEAVWRCAEMGIDRGWVDNLTNEWIKWIWETPLCQLGR